MAANWIGRFSEDGLMPHERMPKAKPNPRRDKLHRELAALARGQRIRKWLLGLVCLSVGFMVGMALSVLLDG